MKKTDFDEMKSFKSLLDYDVDNQALFKELLEVPEAYNRLKKMGMSDEFILANMEKIIDFVRDAKYCLACPGKEKCKKTNPFMCTKITLINGVCDRQLVPCNKMIEALTSLNSFYVSDIEERNLNASFNGIDKTGPRRQAILKLTKFFSHKSKDWVYITGTPSTGRSYFASAAAYEGARKKLKNVCYLNCVFRFQELNNLFYNDTNTFREMFETYQNADLLILDEFGNEPIKESIRDSIIYPLLYTRSSKGLMTIIVSDMPIEDLESLYSNNRKSIRAKQIKDIIQNKCGEEINFGNISIY